MTDEDEGPRWRAPVASDARLGGTPDDTRDDTRAEATDEAPRRRKRSVGNRVALVVLGLLVLLGLLVVLALPFLTVRTEGNQARANLNAALAQLRAGDLAAATERVEAARADVTAADAAANGTRAGILGTLPIAGDAVADVRYLVSALDQAVAVAEVGVELYPSVLGEDAALIQDSVVDLSVLQSVNTAVDAVSKHLDRARADLDAIGASSPVIGEPIASARDSALEQVVSLQSTLEQYRPLLDQMPTLLGSETPMRYLITVMNSAELRSSGGATLSLGEMVIDQGRIEFGETGSTTDFTEENTIIEWEPVADNPWHVNPPEKLVNATLSPNWTTSGEELLRAWRVTSGNEAQALIALDVPALEDLFRITGPIEIAGYGSLTAGNVVDKLIGSYDDFRTPEERKRVNEALIPVLREKLLEGGKFVQKAQSLVKAAQGRHVITYFRDQATQAVATSLGLTGDLSTTQQDYLGVFTQNTNASKVDIWQRRTVASEVTLLPDGSADVVTTVTLQNDGPPYEQRGKDPESGYYTRWSIPVYIQYLPMGATLQEVTVDGAGRTSLVTLLTERQRPFFRTSIVIEPGATSIVVTRYRVPRAAVPVGDGLQYTLDIDPQGLVIPTQYSVVLHLPDGYHESGIDDDWTVRPDLTLELDVPDDARLRTTVTFVQE